MSETPFSDWVHERPEHIQRLMIDWPPAAIVRTKPGEVLMVPAPGIEGEIASWFEDGTVGVHAQIPVGLTSPASGEHLAAGEVLKGQCDPAKLEVVRYAEMPDGTVLDPDHIRFIINSPVELDLRGGGCMTEAAAVSAARTYLREMAARGGFANEVMVIYDDPAGFRVHTVAADDSET